MIICVRMYMDEGDRICVRAKVGISERSVFSLAFSHTAVYFLFSLCTLWLFKFAFPYRSMTTYSAEFVNGPSTIPLCPCNESFMTPL